MFCLSGKVLEGNNVPWGCLFMAFYLMFSFCYLVYHWVQFLVFWFSQYIPFLLKSLRNDMELKSIYFYYKVIMSCFHNKIRSLLLLLHIYVASQLLCLLFEYRHLWPIRNITLLRSPKTKMNIVFISNRNLFYLPTSGSDANLASITGTRKV